MKYLFAMTVVLGSVAFGLKAHAAEEPKPASCLENHFKVTSCTIAKDAKDNHWYVTQTLDSITICRDGERHYSFESLGEKRSPVNPITLENGVYIFRVGAIDSSLQMILPTAGSSANAEYKMVGTKPDGEKLVFKAKLICN